MPSLVRKLLIFAAVDGLVLQPAPPRNHPPATQQAIKIDYKGNVSPLLKDRREEDTTPVSLEAHGIIGLLKVASVSFLISICGREQVTQIRGKPIYVITDVALIPLSSQAEADKVITATKEHLQRHSKLAESGAEEQSESDDDDATQSIAGDSLDESVLDTPPKEVETDAVTGQKAGLDKKTSVAEDVIGKKGAYGRFAARWFSKKGWSTEGRRMQGMSSEEDLARKQAQTPSQSAESLVPEEEELATGPKNPEDAPEAVKKQVDAPAVSPEEIPKALAEPGDNSTVTLLPKILRTTKLYFGSRNFYFSYEYDLSRGLGGQASSASSLPLCQQYDPLFFWNHHIVSPFIEAGQHNFVLPVLQGFVGQRAFTVNVSDDSSNSAVVSSASKPEDVIAAQPEAAESGSSPNTECTALLDQDPRKKDFLLTLISRRSTKRAGLRYLRRGVDDEGHAANSVETEQILSSPSWDSAQDRVYSFTQFRGSIPLFFSQSPYSLKPIPMFWGSPETNATAFKLHFANLAARYGNIQVASLVDKHGSESKIGEAFEKQAGTLDSNGGIDGKGTQLGFEWFDFHNICRGMRFENISILMNALDKFMTSSGWTVLEGDTVVHRQSGVLRTNCMDCLDRTNVVQSACARTALENQLAAHSIFIDLQTDPSTAWFNTLWADNGDAISKQYAGTAALKGDFTRTRHRNISGALTDFGLTLSRYYNNIVNDYFAQALIDYLLGRATDSIFSEFEADMKAQDYFVDLRKVRQAAIERCAGIVIENENENLISGWTLSCPSEPNTLRSGTFEEAVLLLTEQALYFCRLDWGTEKVREFERVDLEALKAIWRGVYITSTLATRHMDEERNVGFLIRYKTDTGKELVRVNTRSLDSKKDNSKKGKQKQTEDDGVKFLAFKALPPQSSIAAGEGVDVPVSEVQMVKGVCEEIARVANKTRKITSVTESVEAPDSEKGLVVEEKDVISLANAKKSTGYFEQLGYSLKRLVWA
ncbi:hypothetical protein AOQ84DRAFT_107100 [Glonium stellatum]|uniref:SacI domain-containing protein n=1 Tax=Glonium stellatum TaxID=574774 RepID=A0A8E2EUH5_9PEZI|nr:hypothetical protein AOQ84DRAFT_107100 [Glonium stellatum]